MFDFHIMRFKYLISILNTQRRPAPRTDFLPVPQIDFISIKKVLNKNWPFQDRKKEGSPKRLKDDEHIQEKKKNKNKKTKLNTEGTK